MFVRKFQLQFCWIVVWETYTKFSGLLYFVPRFFTVILTVYH